MLELRRGDRVVRVRDHVTPLDDAGTVDRAHDKAHVHRLLVDAGVPVPEHAPFVRDDLRPALALLDATGGPLVVKPVGSSFGSGVTGGISTAAQLTRAVWRAARLDRRLLAERQADGDVYRLLFLDGQLLDVIRRRPPSVTGDGVSTVAELVARENVRRRAARPTAALLRLDLDAVFALAAQRLTPGGVPAARRVVAVKTAVSQNSERENETVREDVSPLVEDARRAAALTGLRLAGVDAITRDPTRPLAETGGVVLEVNGNPGLHYHYDVADPAQATRVAVPVLDALLSS